MGGGGERSPWAGRHIAGLARQWRFPASHRSGFDGITKATGPLTRDAPTDSSKRRRTEEDTTQRSGSTGGSGKATGADDARGSSVSAALDMQERAESGCGTPSSRTPGEPYAGSGTTAPTEI